MEVLPAAEETLPLDAGSLLKAGSFKGFALTESSDTLLLCYRLLGKEAGSLLEGEAGSLVLVLKEVSSGNVLSRTTLATIDQAVKASSEWTLYQVPLAPVKTASGTSDLALEIELTSLKDEGKALLLSLGHIYSGVAPAPLARRTGEALSVVPRPERFHLAESYPNPFNPSTTIGFALPQGAQMDLVVYDVLGREVATLAEGIYPAGYHTVLWGAQGVASGLYFARLTVSDALGKVVYAKTNKLLLTR